MIGLSLHIHPVRQLLTRAHLLPVLGYAAAVMSLAVISWLAIASLVAEYAEYRSAAETLERLEGRKNAGQAAGLSLPGSPFLEGPTVEVAGAALQQRVVSAVKSAGGHVLSSQIDLQGSETKQGFVSLSANCEIDQGSLQQLLYELESGMPFLFIDRLVIQMPQSDRGIGGTETARMRVQIDISGQWQVTK